MARIAPGQRRLSRRLFYNQHRKFDNCRCAYYYQPSYPSHKTGYCSLGSTPTQVTILQVIATGANGSFVGSTGSPTFFYIEVNGCVGDRS